MSKLTINDYINILTFYNKPIPKNNILIKQKAETLIATKLCRCIKKVNETQGARAIGICTQTIINSKGFTRKNMFTCKKPQHIQILKTKKNKSKKN